MIIPSEIVQILNKAASHHFNVNDLKMLIFEHASLSEEV